MNYKLFVYIVITLLSAVAVSGINFNNIFRKDKTIEAKILVFLFILALSYLVTNFIGDFLEVSQIA